MNRRTFVRQSAMVGAAAGVSLSFPLEAAMEQVIRIGIIGLDTSHAPAFAKMFNAGNPAPAFQGFKVVSAFPRGSADIESSASRIPKYTEEVKSYGVSIAGSIAELLSAVDVVLLETNDGRPRKEQAFEVLNARKPMFIDKPVAASFKDVVSIYSKARELQVPVFSTSSLRYLPAAQAVRYENKIGKVLGADTFSPATLESHHPDLYWYGIHGVEILFTVMGPGCESVTRYTAGNTELVVGQWNDGRIGTFRGTREGKHEYGGTAFGANANLSLGPFDGYEGLAKKIASFFRTRQSPVDDHETLEVYAFMQAADESKRRGGGRVTLKEVMDLAK